MTTADDREHIGGLELEAEFERVPVPEGHRKSLRTVAAVWFGFPMILTCAVFGGVLAALLGFQRALLAILVGNLVLFAYVGALSYFAGRTGPTSRCRPVECSAASGSCWWRASCPRWSSAGSRSTPA